MAPVGGPVKQGRRPFTSRRHRREAGHPIDVTPCHNGPSLTGAWTPPSDEPMCPDDPRGEGTESRVRGRPPGPQCGAQILTGVDEQDPTTTQGTSSPCCVRKHSSTVYGLAGRVVTPTTVPLPVPWVDTESRPECTRTGTRSWADRPDAKTQTVTLFLHVEQALHRRGGHLVRD